MLSCWDRYKACARRAWPRPSLRPKASKYKRHKKQKNYNLKAKSKLTASQKQKQQKSQKAKSKPTAGNFPIV